MERLDASATATLVAEAQRKAQDLGRTSAALDAQARAASLRGGSSGAGDLWTVRLVSPWPDKLGR